MPSLNSARAQRAPDPTPCPACGELMDYTVADPERQQKIPLDYALASRCPHCDVALLQLATNGRRIEG